MMTTPILVTGALGNVGAAVVNHLLEKGYTVRVGDIDLGKLKERFGDSVEAVCFDFSDPTTYEATFRGVQKMFLMRPPHVTNIKRDMYPSIDAAKRAGVNHVVFLSLIGIENAKYVPHYKLEQYLQKIGLQTTFLRCSFFMQNLNTTHRKEIQERSEIFVPVGKAKTSFIDVRDIGAVAAVTLTKEGHAGNNYDLTGSEGLDYWEVAQIMSEVLGRKITYRNPNPLSFLIETVRRGIPFRFAVVMLGLYTSTRFGMAEPITNEVERLTGRKSITFRQYAQDYRDAWIQK
ncbi:MAG TPA: SDR family oxidoreductase [Anaerolineales bacterium]|nr:SDR family oxidoreductase [Anaerolineales bacterium]